MNRYNLDTCATIVEFGASVWTARKLDRGASDEVESNKNAKAKGAARVNKNLLAGRDELEKISKHVTVARTYVYDNTFPWSDAGQRLLPSARFLSFDKRMSNLKAEFDELVTEFVDAYPTLITAQAMALGELFNRNEYPSVAEIQRRFDFRIDYLPVPSAGDFRVDVGNEALKEMQAKLEAAAQYRTERMLASLQEAVGEHLRRMTDRLTSDIDPKTNEPKQRRFHDTLVTSAYELCDLVRDMPVLGNHKVAAACRQLEQALGGASAQELRDDPIKRDEVKRTAEQLLDKFSL